MGKIFSAVLMCFLCVATLSGCDYLPRTVYEIETKDGGVLKRFCPTIDRDRSKLTYVIEGECVATK